MIDSLLHWFAQRDLLAAFADPLDRQRYLAGFGYTLLLAAGSRV